MRNVRYAMATLATAAAVTLIAGHGGGPWGMMGAGWRHDNGSFGMAFPFTTA